VVAGSGSMKASERRQPVVRRAGQLDGAEAAPERGLESLPVGSAAQVKRDVAEGMGSASSTARAMAWSVAAPVHRLPPRASLSVSGCHFRSGKEGIVETASVRPGRPLHNQGWLQPGWSCW